MSEIPGNRTTVALSDSSRPGPLLPARSSTVGISTSPAPPLKPPPHPNNLTDGRMRGRTELVVCKNGRTFYRKPKTPKPPKDSKVRKVAFAYRNARAAGLGAQEIADAMGLKVTTVQSYVKIAARNGWFEKDAFADPSERLEEIISHQVVDNIEKVLTEKEQVVVDKETGETRETDRLSNRAVKMTKDVALGIGLWKTHQVTKSEGQTNVGVALKVDVVMPAAGTTPQIRPGSFGGTPAFDAEIIEGDPQP